MSAGRPVDLLEGNLDDIALERVLDRLGTAEVTGILTVQSHEDIVAISFEAGRIVGADALNETLEDGLGGALVTEGLVTAEQFGAVLARVRSERLRLSDVLVDAGLMTSDDYLAAVRRFTLALVARSASWRRGDFKFYAGDEVSYEEGFESIGVAEVAAMRASGRELERPAPAAAAAAEVEPAEEPVPVAAVEDGTDAGVSKPEAIAGNFFLDPEFVERIPEPAAVPLVLLD